MANRFLNNVKINDAYTLPETIGTTGQYIKLTDAGTGTTDWADLGQAAEVSTISYDVRNETGSSIPAGSVVYVSGGAGSSGNVRISLSIATTEAGSSKTFGITAETIANNSDGKVILEGIVEGIDTSSYSPGQTLWLSTTAGQFTGTPPTTPNHAVFVGYAVRCQQNNGSMFVKIQNGYELGEIHDVKITSVADNQLIAYDSALGYWVNSNDLTLSGLHIDSTGAVEMPTGTDGERPTGIAGMFRFNTTSNQFEGYNGTEWGAIAGSGGGGGGSELSIERDVFTATANQTAFVISSAITASSNTQVYIDGVYQSKDNYTTNGSTVTFSTGVPLGAEVEVIHFISVLSKVYTDTFTGDAFTVDFTASKDVTDENVTQVYIDGVYQSKDNYTTSGTTITFSTAPPNGSAIEVVHFTAAEYSALNSNQFTGTGSQTDFTLTQAVDIDKSFVFIQGIYQEKSTYSISGTTLTFTTAPQSGYTIEVITVGAVSIFNDTLFLDSFTGNNSTTDFTLSTTPASENAIDVYLNGIYQNKSTFSLSGSTLIFSSAPTTGTAIEVKSTGGLNNVVSSGSGGGISWQTTPKTSAFTAVAGEGYFVNTTSGGVTVTLPSSPSAGDEVTIVDYAGTADTNNITITSSDNINGGADDVIIRYERGGVSMVYADATQGWIAYNAANETATGLRSPLPPLTVDYLVVAGGGGTARGNYSSGGGGAGGLRTSYNDNNVSAQTLSTSTNYTLTVGAGGAGVANGAGGSGGNSTFNTITSAGGGGGYGSQNVTYGDGADGGSGGGGSGEAVTSGGTGNTPSVTPSQGNNGGSGTNLVPSYAGGGGGGANAVGANATASAAGNGGAGLAVNIISTTNAVTASVGEVSGSDVYFSGGGGGASEAASTPGTGGTGGGGNGGNDTNGGSTNGTVNTGGGAGGKSYYTSPSVGRDGGSGVVILRYPNAYSITVGSGIIEASGSPFTEGTDKVSVFTAGTGNISFS